MAAFYLYNDTASIIEISENGLFIAAGENYGFEYNDIDDIYEPGGDLETYINDGSLLLTTDPSLPPATNFTSAEALEVLSLRTYAREVVYDPANSTYITSNDVQSAMEELDASISSVNNTLDEAYDAGGPGAGRAITVDNGAVQLDSTTGDYSPLELTNRTAAPATSLASGQIIVVSNILYIYDGTRAKFLSPSKLIGFGRAGAADGVFLLGPGDLATQDSGWALPRDGTILSAAGTSSGGNGTKGLRLGINGTEVQSASYSGGEILLTSINIDFNAGDNIQVYVVAAGAAINDPELTLEIAWRI